VVDSLGSSPPSIGSLWVGIRPGGNLRNSPAACAPANASFPDVVLEGDFGPSNVFITDFFAEDPDNLDNEISSGDSLLITFSRRTSKGGLPDILNKKQLDSLLSFTHPIGLNYTGAWLNNGTVIYIHIHNATGGNPKIGVSSVSVRALGDIRNWPPACKPSTATSPLLRGDFGRTIPYITKIIAKDPYDRDQNYGFLDTISIYFSEPTDRGGYELNTRISLNNLQLMLGFTHAMGSISAQWSSDTLLVITVEGTVGATPPSIGNLNISCKGPIQIPFTTPEGYTFNPVFKPIMKNTGSKACFRTSPPLEGDFGPSSMTLNYLLAVSSPEADTFYGNGDQIKVKFSQDTSMNGKKIGQLQSKAEVDAIFNFPCSIGSYYVGTWETRQIFVITIWDAEGACNPILGEFSINVNKTGNIRNHPPQSKPNEAQSPTLTGDFGPSPLEILAVVGQSSPVVDDKYGEFDTLTLKLSHDTDRAGMPLGEIIGQSMLRKLFDFGNMSLGVFFFGMWMGPRELRIVIEDAGDATPPSLPCDPDAVCVGEANTRIGNFLASGNLRSLPKLTAPVVATAPKLSGSFGLFRATSLTVCLHWMWAACANALLWCGLEIEYQ